MVSSQPSWPKEKPRGWGPICWVPFLSPQRIWLTKTRKIAKQRSQLYSPFPQPSSESSHLEKRTEKRTGCSREGRKNQQQAGWSHLMHSQLRQQEGGKLVLLSL